MAKPKPSTSANPFANTKARREPFTKKPLNIAEKNKSKPKKLHKTTRTSQTDSDTSDSGNDGDDPEDSDYAPHERSPFSGSDDDEQLPSAVPSDDESHDQDMESPYDGPIGMTRSAFPDVRVPYVRPRSLCSCQPSTLGHCFR